MNIDMNLLNMNEENNIIHTKKGTYIININALKRYLNLKLNTNNNPYKLCVVKNDKYKRSIAVANNNLEEIFIAENKLEKLNQIVINHQNGKTMNTIKSILGELFDVIALLLIGIAISYLDIRLIGKLLVAALTYLPTKAMAITAFDTRISRFKERKKLRENEPKINEIKNKIKILEKELEQIKRINGYKKVSLTTLSNTIDQISNKPIVEYVNGDESLIGYKVDDKTIKIEDKPKVKDIEIEITNIGNFIKVDIKEDCNINEYMKAIKKLNAEDINQDVFNNALFDAGGLDIIHKKTIYIVKNDYIIYNIINDDDFLYIDERIKHENSLDENLTTEEKVVKSNKLYIDERIIRVNKHNKEYKISRLMHDNSLSTFYVKFFESEDPNRLYFKLDKIEALEAANLILTNLSKIKNIETLVDFNFIDEAINKKEHQKVLTKKV